MEWADIYQKGSDCYNLQHPYYYSFRYAQEQYSSMQGDHSY